MALLLTWTAGRTNHKRVRERLEMGGSDAAHFFWREDREKNKIFLRPGGLYNITMVMQIHQACEKQHFKKLLAENFTLYNPSPTRHF